mmetsp:Transcript_6333/g.15306  ORF Transcript_6333/g.15306 Transcript_6333/m.15306 type:complete len:230 (+) Transcript_6333:33-722(+)|eukprot:CAMPEP_0173423786 /NCGR_PEP_ID=MMETSP1357-20121228/3941_1 /TAXON_ID=77926 /ORGANISM="Hemiselmis rufescens, Strain PCC563" /LENGTH=229 /DNA_ID=CAMNT_0014386937 /DNA_START=26 /DNA_END=715 /DNA_ORIENTATION=-
MKPLKDLFSRKKDKPSPAGVAAAPVGAGGGEKRDAVMEMFEKYREKEEGGPEQIGPEGIFGLCGDLELEPTDVRLLILAWKLGAEQQGYFSKSEWQRGMEGLRADSLEALSARLDSLNRQLASMTASPSFREFFRFAFRFSRQDGQKALEIDAVKALLVTVLPPPHRHVERLVKFLEATPAIRGFNEDQWQSFLLFSHEVAADFSNFDPDGAWPSILDDYVEYCKKEVQ